MSSTFCKKTIIKIKTSNNKQNKSIPMSMTNTIFRIATRTRTRTMFVVVVVVGGTFTRLAFHKITSKQKKKITQHKQPNTTNKQTNKNNDCIRVGRVLEPFHVGRRRGGQSIERKIGEIDANRTSIAEAREMSWRRRCCAKIPVVCWYVVVVVVRWVSVWIIDIFGGGLHHSTVVQQK
jgi:hypothetical protein